LLVPVTINDFPVVSMGIFQRGLRATSSRR
jgi:hypothetical protein